MKKVNYELNSIFAIAEEMVKNNGEDCYYFDVTDDRFIIAALDGCGGSGSKKYENYSGKTGAYIASRAVCGGIKSWFCDSGRDDEICRYIYNSLEVCKQFADKTGRIVGSLGKAFPTTAAVISGKINKNNVDVVCYWAGDSRCYMLDANGLHQLTIDDLDGQDAMSNLSNDGVMTNVINASASFEIHNKKLSFDNPCILLTATDGCFGYLNSPMEFEHLLIDTLCKSKNINEWKIALNERMFSVAGDDYTLGVAVCGFSDFKGIQKFYSKRNACIYDKYINKNDAIDSEHLWEFYKEEYSKYI